MENIKWKNGPDFICIGAQRAGTCWLYRQLDAHPDFWMPPYKELHYLNGIGKIKERAISRPARDKRDQDFATLFKQLDKNTKFINIEEYGDLFAPKGNLLSGDITPAYSTLNEEIIHQLMQYFPKLKVIFLARDPVERAWSNLHLPNGNKSGLAGDKPEHIIQALSRPSILLRSHPSKIVSRWKRYVPQKQFRVFFFDNLEKHPIGVLQSIIKFLGGDPAKQPERPISFKKKRNVNLEKPHLNGEVRTHLAQFFKSELKACAEILGGPAKDWPQKYGFNSFLGFLYWGFWCVNIDFPLFQSFL